MVQTLRRSCAACAKSKLGCDLRLPRCSRCIKRQLDCVYANQPLTGLSSAPSSNHDRVIVKAEGSAGSLTQYRPGARDLDPFDSYPHTRLPRVHVQRLIHTFLNKIAFQYYPLDLSSTSNPFLLSWWPLALGDPALFHVSLQTACLDEELLAQKGFQTSEMLMADSVALLRRKVEDTSLAIQDGTLNSVITLAAIEFGKGNIQVGEMHVNGVKKLVNLRGGINAVKQTSPLTARMVSWVAMIVMRHPQFEAQDDLGTGTGIPPIPEWQQDPASTLDEDNNIYNLSEEDCDYAVRNVFIRLRGVFQQAKRTPLAPTPLHDLGSFVIHRLLNIQPSNPSPLSECVRYAIVCFMFVAQGPTYYSHAVILGDIVSRFQAYLRQLHTDLHLYDNLDVWLLTVGLVASTGTNDYQWFVDQARVVAVALDLQNWDDVLARIKSVMWLDTPHAEAYFRTYWDDLFRITDWVEVYDQG